MPALAALPLVLQSSKRKMLKLLAISLAFVAIGIFLLDEESLIGIVTVAFFGLCGVVGAVNLHPRASYLELTEQGFAFASLFRRSFVPWREVRGFFPIQVETNVMVGWNYAPHIRHSATMRKVSTSLANVEAALPDTYGMRADDLASLLNELHRKYQGEA